MKNLDFQEFRKICLKLSKQARYYNYTSKYFYIDEDGFIIFSDRFILFRFRFQQLNLGQGTYNLDLKPVIYDYENYKEAIPPDLPNKMKIENFDEYDYWRLAKLDLIIPFKYWTILQKYFAGKDWFIHFNQGNKPVIFTPIDFFDKHLLLQENLIIIMPRVVPKF